MKRISKKKLAVIGCLALTLIITGGIFAYGALTNTITADVTPISADFADVEAGTAPSWTVFGGYIGRIGSQDVVFTIKPASGFTGKFVVQLSLTNVEKLTQVYRALGMNFEVAKGDFTSVTTNPTTSVFLSLEHPVVEVEVDGYSPAGGGGRALRVNLTSGFYKSQWGAPWTAGYEDPIILCKVIQKGSV